MTHRDLTITEVLKDPLIRQIMRADHISVTGMASLLKDAARRQRRAREFALSADFAQIASAAARTVNQADLR
ncbi:MULTISPECIES: hypothetical protein [Rhizobium]|uniref:Uncharacterized protein n=1 Tax=Rhizobium miluonense TaxID=411945 RepID=A0A1C3W5T5_9HYPH|nr:hypothetical protein [Rhizobium miluonense]SCB35178.1 hypothetical protein GA0061102_102331 [Rhizobium miluonense]